MSQHRFQYEKGKTVNGVPVERVGRFGIYVDEHKLLKMLAQRAATSKGKRSQLKEGAVIVEYFGDVEG